MYDLNSINDFLNTKIIGQTIIQYDTLTSTYAKAKNIFNTCPDGTVVLSENQTKFTVRFGNEWICQEDKNIYLSIILKPGGKNLKISKFDIIGCASVCKAVADTYNVESKIKWPNDIMINGNKISSVSCSFVGKNDEPSGVIISMAINANIETNEIDRINEEIENSSTSLKIETGTDVHRELIIGHILNNVEIHYDEFIKQGTITNAVNSCIHNSAIVNKTINVIKRGKKTVRKVYAKNIDSEGCLVVDNEKNNEEILSPGETIIVYERKA
ncbi:MAG: biotin--[acetyl-CoA-carboxylase] ligase [Sedimentibacter sp.]